MNLNKIHYFIALADTGNYADAAVRAGLPEQALRMYIYNLVKKEGCEFFDKQKNSLVLTEAGKVYYNHLKRISGILDNTRKSIRLLSGKTTNRKRIGITPSHGAQLIARIIRIFSDRYPGERIELVSSDPLNLRNMLQEGKLDFAFVNCPPPERLPFGITAYPVYRREFMIAVPASHRLAHDITEYKDLPIVNINEFRDDSFIMYDEGSYLDEIVRPLVETFPFVPIVAITTGSAILARSLLEANYGVALSRFLAGQQLIRYYKLAQPVYSYYTIITLKGYEFSEAERYLVYLMTEAAKSEPNLEVISSQFRTDLYKEFQTPEYQQLQDRGGVISFGL